MSQMQRERRGRCLEKTGLASQALRVSSNNTHRNKNSIYILIKTSFQKTRNCRQMFYLNCSKTPFFKRHRPGLIALWLYGVAEKKEIAPGFLIEVNFHKIAQARLATENQ